MTINPTPAETALQFTRQHFRHLGLDLPASLTAALDQADAEAQAMREAITADDAALGEAVAAAVKAGKDPATDKAVTAHLARRQLGSLLGDAFEEGAKARRAEAIAAQVPAIIATLAPVVEEADATLADLRAKVPGVDLTSPHLLNSVPTAHLTLAGQARDAVARLERIGQLWPLLAQAAGVRYVAEMAPLVLADLGTDELDALPRQARGGNMIAAAHAGHRLALATLEDYQMRCRDVEAERAERRAREDEATDNGRRIRR